MADGGLEEHGLKVIRTEGVNSGLWGLERSGSRVQSRSVGERLGWRLGWSLVRIRVANGGVVLLLALLASGQ